jgi:signal transduction histidine kinase
VFSAVRIQLIASVVGVLAMVLLAAGGATYAVLSQQLDAAVRTELRAAAARYSGGMFTVSKAGVAPAAVGGSGMAIVSAGGPPPDSATGLPAPPGGQQAAGFSVGLPKTVPVDQSSDGTFAMQWLDGDAVTRLGAPPAGLPAAAALASARPASDAFSTVRIGGQRYALLSRSLPGPPGAPTAIVQAGVSLAARDREQRTVLLALAGGGALGLVLTLLGAVFLTGRAVAPVQAAFERQRRFVGDASHELRTPLTLVRLEAESLSRHLNAGDSARPLLRQIDRTARLVDDLLTLAQIDDRALPFEREPVHLASLVDTAAAAARSLAPPAVTVTHHAATDLWVDGDRDRLARVLLILVDNACRAVSAGDRIAISARGDGGTALLQVADTGRGIPPEQLPQVFARFSRVDRARTRAAGGAGLGLAIAQEIVRAHGGTIALDSALGAGTTATVRLARAAAPAPVGDELSDAPAV